MTADTDGEYRVLGRRQNGLVLVDRDGAFDPVFVTADSSEPALEPGYLVDAHIGYDEAGNARLESASVLRRTVYEFVEHADTVFQAARDAWNDARVAGDGMASTVTRDTDGERNGVLYLFADEGVGDRFAEFRSGERPIEPLVDRVNEAEGPAEREVFVVSPADEGFVIVYIALRKGGPLADAMRDTYDLPGGGEAHEGALDDVPGVAPRGPPTGDVPDSTDFRGGPHDVADGSHDAADGPRVFDDSNDEE